MNKIRFFATLLTALFVAASFGFAHEGEDRPVKIKLGTDGETFDISDLEVGETRQLFTESGQEVVVTRQEHGYDLTVDGKEIRVVSPRHHAASFISLDRGDSHATFDVVVKSVTGAGEHAGENLYFASGDEESGEGEHAFVWVGAGEGAESAHAYSFGAELKSVADHVLESKVLDQLDEATRQEILDVIEEAEKARPWRRFSTATKTIVIDTDDEDDDGQLY